MKRIIATATAVAALAAVGAGSALADNTGAQGSTVAQGSSATSVALNIPTLSLANFNASSSSSGNAASVKQIMKQFNLGF